MSVEDRLRKQDETIKTLVKEYDSMSVGLNETLQALEDVKGKMGIFIDSVVNDPKRIENIIFDKLIALKALYKTEPYDPDRVKLLIREIASYREKAVPTLEGLLLNTKTDRYIRMYSAALLGEMGNTASSDILLDVLAKTADPDIKIEILIAIGKLKETRAMYMIEQLANSPNDAIAITAQDVLLRLSKETGAEISSGLQMRRIKVDEEKVLADKKKGVIPEKLYIPDTVKAPKEVVTEASEKDTSRVDEKVAGAIEETDIQTGEKESIVVDKEEAVKTAPEETPEEAKPEEEVEKVTDESEKKEKVEKEEKSDKRKDKKEGRRRKKKEKEEDEKRDRRRDKKEDTKRDREKEKEKEEKKKKAKEEAEKNW